ncbi:MAG: asparagine--tRNA ligase [Candidatus Doudnabacteria bacterium RIFCSPHIGHO2_01_FULL_46_14]|uniref:Asparagine--tRNA ligase n=1 Tax=Candidatus Doudnabacteria bacterium RIFCSPHIGHO2_01_FULL_46_14 TaxID=1817824 RepID=A0A1F5NN31_9BACT|nr:MAG: asparagine--tRNA ligase [Candidatus Doudnabacteria bacterium RIFCSPHIGHO2_01_FULL_46_14]
MNDNVVYIQDIAAHNGELVTIRGWVHNKRTGGKIQFIIVRDGTGYIQAVVVKRCVSAEILEAADSLTHESSIEVTGRVRADERAPSGYELDLTDLKIHQVVVTEEPFPITPKEHGIEFLMDQRHLWIRSTRQRAILKIRHEIIKAVRDFLDEDGFTLCDAPILSANTCEGTTTPFKVNYFNERAFLTQSGQLYNEATAAALGKVYCFGPTFRAEKSKTRRHLTEFWMVEPEVAYATVEDTMDLAERMITFVVWRVIERRSTELKALERDLSRLEKIATPFPRISYDEAIDILKKHGSEIQWGGDFGGADETIISMEFDRPVMVHRHPVGIKAFYMDPDPTRFEVSLSVDVLAPEGYGEIVGGGQRISSYDLLVERFKEHVLPQPLFQWYLDLRKFGSVPHSGFGAGIERLVTWICGLEHVRETIAFPRMLYRLTP